MSASRSCRPSLGRPKGRGVRGSVPSWFDCSLLCQPRSRLPWLPETRLRRLGPRAARVGRGLPQDKVSAAASLTPTWTEPPAGGPHLEPTPAATSEATHPARAPPPTSRHLGRSPAHLSTPLRSALSEARSMVLDGTSSRPKHRVVAEQAEGAAALPPRSKAWVGAAAVSDAGVAPLYVVLGWSATSYGGTVAGLIVATIPATQRLLLLVGGTVADRFGPRGVTLTGDALLCSRQVCSRWLLSCSTPRCGCCSWRRPSRGWSARSTCRRPAR